MSKGNEMVIWRKGNTSAQSTTGWGYVQPQL